MVNWDDHKSLFASIGQVFGLRVRVSRGQQTWKNLDFEANCDHTLDRLSSLMEELCYVYTFMIIIDQNRTRNLNVSCVTIYMYEDHNSM